MDEGLKVLVYGDEAIDVHLLVDNVAPEAVLNDKLNGQSVRMVKDRTGHKLVCDLITEIYDGLFESDNGMDFDKVYQMCSCPAKANYAYYIWKKNPVGSSKRKNKPQNGYYKDLFLGAKFDCINHVDQAWIDEENEGRDNLFDRSEQDKADMLIFYDRHYNTGNEGCNICDPSARKCDENYGIIKNILEKQKENPPFIFIRTAHENGKNLSTVKPEPDEMRIPKEIISMINENDKLRKNTIVLIKLNDLKELGAELPVKYSWEELVRSTYTELKHIRSDKERSKYIVKAPLIIVDFDYDGYAAFRFTDTSDSCCIVYNKSQINGTGFRELSETGSIPSSTSILQSIVVDFMIRYYLLQRNSKGVDFASLDKLVIDQFYKNLELVLKICYLSIYRYCSSRRELKTTRSGVETFSVDKENLASFIRDAYTVCRLHILEKSQQMSDDEKKEFDELCGRFGEVDKNHEDFIRKHLPGFVVIEDLNQRNPPDFSEIIMKKEHYDTYKLCKRIVEEGLSVTEVN